MPTTLTLSSEQQQHDLSSLNGMRIAPRSATSMRSITTNTSDGDETDASSTTRGSSLYGFHYLHQHDRSMSMSSDNTDMEYSSADEEYNNNFHASVNDGADQQDDFGMRGFLPMNYVARAYNMNARHYHSSDGETSSVTSDESSHYFRVHAPQPRSYKHINKKLPPSSISPKKSPKNEHGLRLGKSLLRGAVKPLKKQPNGKESSHYSNIENEGQQQQQQSLMGRTWGSFRKTNNTLSPFQEEDVHLSFDSTSSEEGDFGRNTSSDFSLLSIDNTSSIEIWETSTNESMSTDEGMFSTTTRSGQNHHQQQQQQPETTLLFDTTTTTGSATDYSQVLEMIAPPVVERKVRKDGSSSMLVGAFPLLQAHSAPSSPSRDGTTSSSFLHKFPNNNDEQDVEDSDDDEFDPFLVNFGNETLSPDSQSPALDLEPTSSHDFEIIPEGLRSRASTEEVISKLGLGQVGRSAVMDLHHQAADAASVGSTNNNVDNNSLNTFHVMGVDIPSYESYVKQAVATFRRDVLKVSDEKLASLQKEWGPSEPSLAAAQ